MRIVPALFAMEAALSIAPAAPHRLTLTPKGRFAVIGGGRTPIKLQPGQMGDGPI
jgi:hypothetical protein